MATEVTTSKQFSVNWRDIAKALVIATLTPAVVIIQASIDAGVMTFNWKQIMMAAIAGFVGYLIKNFLTPAQTVITGTPLPKKVSDENGNDLNGDTPPVPPIKP